MAELGKSARMVSINNARFRNGQRKGSPLAAFYGYGNVLDRGFVAFERELDDGAWKQVSTKKFEEEGKKNAAALLMAPQPVVWKLRLRWGIEVVIEALGVPSLGALDQGWDATQRRLFHRIAAGRDDEDRAVRDAADRLYAQLLSGKGTEQTGFDLDDEVDFGRNQVRLTKEGSPLAADVKKVKLGDVLSDVEKTTEALAKGLGRATGTKRQAPSRRLREAVAECAAAFNSVHDDLVWFAQHTQPSPERDNLHALLKPLEDLLTRHEPTAAAADPAAPAAPATQPATEPKPG